jgi:NAD-dependent dihydropyrimidine dehydrogenase PreA subunit
MKHLTKVTKGTATFSDLEELKTLGGIIKDTALCGLGQTSPNPVLSTMTHFWNEYEEHVRNKHVHLELCKDLVKYEVVEDKCIGCTACSRVCPVNCISGEVKKVHTIDQEACIRCGACYSSCKFSAIKRVLREVNNE